MKNNGEFTLSFDKKTFIFSQYRFEDSFCDVFRSVKATHIQKQGFFWVFRSFVCAVRKMKTFFYERETTTKTPLMLK